MRSRTGVLVFCVLYKLVMVSSVIIILVLCLYEADLPYCDTVMHAIQETLNLIVSFFSRYHYVYSSFIQECMTQQTRDGSLSVSKIRT
jgi:hypothetical protein